MNQRFLRILLILMLCGLFVFFYLYIPIYPSPYVSVESYTALQEALEKSPDIVLLAPDRVAFSDSYVLHLNYRGRLARANGYGISGTLSGGTASLYIGCHTITQEEGEPEATMDYRGVSVHYASWRTETVFCHSAYFSLNGYYYEVHAYLDLPDEALTTHDEESQAIITEYAKAIIDVHADAS